MSASLLLQKRGNGLCASGQHSCRPGKAKPFPESFFFVASTETSALLEQRYHLIREGLKTFGVDIHNSALLKSRFDQPGSAVIAMARMASPSQAAAIRMNATASSV